MRVCVKVGFVGEEKAVPNQSMNSTYKEDAGGMAVYVRRADYPHWHCVGHPLLIHCPLGFHIKRCLGHKKIVTDGASSLAGLITILPMSW